MYQDMPDRFIQLPVRRRSEEIDNHVVQIITPDPAPPSPIRQQQRNSRDFDIHFRPLSLFGSSKKKKDKEIRIRRGGPVVVVNPEPQYQIPPQAPDPPPPGPEHLYQPHPLFPLPPPQHPPPIQRHHFREPSPEIIEIRPRPRLPAMADQSPSPPPLVREHRRTIRPAGQRARTPSPRRNDPTRQVNRERDLRRQAQAEQRQAETERARRQQWEAEAIRADADRIRAEEQTRRAEMAAENARVQLQRERLEVEREREREREETERMGRLQRQIEEGRAQIDALRRGDRPEISLQRRAEMERERREAERREAERREAERREIIEQDLRDAQRQLDIERERREFERRAPVLPTPRRRDPPRVTQERVESMTERGERVIAEAREATRRRQEAALLGIDRPQGQGRGSGGELERRVSGRRRGRGGERIIHEDDHRRRGNRYS